jgi:hypothetical protein
MCLNMQGEMRYVPRYMMTEAHLQLVPGATLPVLLILLSVQVRAVACDCKTACLTFFNCLPTVGCNQ